MEKNTALKVACAYWNWTLATKNRELGKVKWGAG